MESMRLPRKPATVIEKNVESEERLMRRAPARAPNVPNRVNPPEVPGGTLRRFFSVMGAFRERSPISVAQVSAVAAARDPKKSW